MLPSTPDLCDQFPEHFRIMAPLYQDYGKNSRFSGRVTTVKCFEDNSIIKALSNTQGYGGVVVVDGGGSLKKALLGDVIAADFVANGWAGIVIDGCVRDVDILKTLPFGIRARNSIPLKTERRGQGIQDQDIEIAGITVRSGDYLVADETGIIVSATPLTA